MEQIVRTYNAGYLQTSQLLGLPVTILPNTTVNEKLDIHDNISIAAGEIPTMKYVVIGNGGHAMTVGADGIPTLGVKPHRPKDAGLYSYLPFILREPSNDLAAVERVNYRLRRLETHGGVTYVAYYAKVLNLSAVNPQLEYRQVSGDVTTSTPFIPSVADLSPTPPAIGPNGVLVTSGDYIATTAKVPFTMSLTEVEEFKNACNIIYGSDRYAIISEIGLCSGVDRAVTGDFNGSTQGYTDAIAVQILNFINAFIPAEFNNSAVNLTFDVGAVEPMLTVSNL
jgi:hypothetical protein